MFDLLLSKESEKFIKKCDKSTRDLIISKLEKLKNDPHIGKPLLANLSGFYSLRIEEYRAIYAVKNKELKILVINIRHRKNIYSS